MVESVFSTMLKVSVVCGHARFAMYARPASHAVRRLHLDADGSWQSFSVAVGDVAPSVDDVTYAVSATMSEDGRAVGCSDGWLDGSIVGCIDGRDDGCIVGWVVGCCDGCPDGCLDGRIVGCVVGSLDGRDVGCVVGLWEGRDVG